MNIDELHRRYKTDARFHAMVTALYDQMASCHMQPYEVKDAAFLAELMFRERHVEPIILTKTEYARLKSQAERGKNPPILDSSLDDV